MKSWVKNLFRPDKVVKNTIKQATTFSIENIATTAMQLSGYDPGILTTLTIKAASNAAGGYVSSKAGDGLYGSGGVSVSGGWRRIIRDRHYLT